jgi:hypothetical protein
MFTRARHWHFLIAHFNPLHSLTPYFCIFWFWLWGWDLTSLWIAAAFTGILLVPGWEWKENEWMNELFFLFSEMWSPQWNNIDRGKPKDSRKTCPIATLSTTNPTGLTRALTHLTAWAMARLPTSARPSLILSSYECVDLQTFLFPSSYKITSFRKPDSAFVIR